MKLLNKDEAKGGVSVKLKPKQVCILGTAETLKDAPFDNEEWDMWGVATCIGHPFCKRLTRILEIHDRASWEPRIAEINATGLPIWMWDNYEEIPLSEKFPLKELQGKYRNYFTNSISFLIAEAIREGYTDIGLFGVHMATTTEYAEQRPSVEYYLGLAEGKGINLWIPDGSDMLKAARVYGYEPESEMKRKLNSLLNDMANNVNNYANQEMNAKDMKNQAIGWREAVKHVKRLLEA